MVLSEKLARRIAYINIAAFFAVLLVAVGTIFAVFRPLRHTAASARRIGQGDLQQRIEWRAQDALGSIGNEFNRMAVRCATCATPRPAAERWNFNSPTRCCNPSLSRSL